MKTRTFQKTPLAIVAFTVLALVAGNAVAQDSTTSTPTAASTAQWAAASPTMPQLSYGVPEILQLTRAKVADSTIIAYIQSSGNNYGLTAAQIIYLRQQGVSEAVLNAMLNQRLQTAQPAPTANAATAQPAGSDAYSAQTSTVAAQAPVTYVPATTSSTVYAVPNTQTYYYYSYPYPYYYPYYYGWPAVSLSFGWGGYYYGGYRGGYYGGWHGGGGGWHGGGGGWHGSGGGWHH